MPLLKNRGQHVRVYRPRGSRYANGRTVSTTEEAIESARQAFLAEFGDVPRMDVTVIEVIGVTGAYVATLLEIKG